MLYQINLEKILFLDIETVPVFPAYTDMPERLRKHWDRKATRIAPEPGVTPDQLYPQAGIYAEFGKVICISSGFFRNGEFRLKSFAGDQEDELLTDFASLLKNHFNTPENLLFDNNGKEFNYSFLSRRMLVNGISLPPILNLAGKKPWDVKHLDTMELWKFGDYKNYTSLDLLAYLFGIDTPKDDMDGSMVSEVYYVEKDLEKIIEYCQKDTLTVAQLFLRYLGRPFLEQEKVTIV